MAVTPKKKIKPPAPVTKGPTGVREELRDVEQRPTVEETDPNFDAGLPLDKSRVDFRDTEFIRVIRQKGYYVRWRKAMLCVCTSQETEQARVPGACDICDGSGYFYIDPHDIQAIMTGLMKNTDIYRKPGRWTKGESVVTVEPQYRIGYRDSIEMLDALSTFNEWIVKGDRRGIRAKLPAGVDSARYRIVKVNALMYSTSDQTVVRLDDGLHFKINEHGWLQWLSEGNKIPDGTVLSLHYEFHPVYIVTSHPHALRETVSSQKKARQTVVRLPLQASVLLDFLLDVNNPLPSSNVC